MDVPRGFHLSFALLALSGMADNVSVVIRSTLVQLLTPRRGSGALAVVGPLARRAPGLRTYGRIG